MLFKLYHVDMIISGIKTETRRNWKRLMAKVNGIYPIQTRMYQPIIECELLKVNYIYEEKLGDMTVEGANKEGYNTIEEFKNKFIDINKSWDDDLEVYVIGFKHLDKKTRNNYITNKHIKIK